MVIKTIKEFITTKNSSSHPLPSFETVMFSGGKKSVFEEKVIFTLPEMHIDFSGDFLDFKILKAEHKNKNKLFDIKMIILKRGGNATTRRGFFGQFKITVNNMNNTNDYSRVCFASDDFKYSQQYIINPLCLQEYIFDFRHFINNMPNTMMLTRSHSNEAKIIIYSSVGKVLVDDEDKNDNEITTTTTTTTPAAVVVGAAKFSRISQTMVHHVNISFTEDVNYFNNIQEIQNIMSDGIVNDILSFYLGIKYKKKRC